MEGRHPVAKNQRAPDTVKDTKPMMRQLVIALFLAICSPGWATGFVWDTAPLLTESELQRLESQLAQSSVPIYVVTCAKAGKSLKDMAGQILAARTTRGYVVVVQTEPHEWQISAMPGSMAAPDVIEAIGAGELVPAFKNGDFAGGLARTAAHLADVTAGGTYVSESARRQRLFLIAILALMAVFALYGYFTRRSCEARGADGDDGGDDDGDDDESSRSGTEGSSGASGAGGSW
jgi:uncharacterized membrane protein YgcG